MDLVVVHQLADQDQLEENQMVLMELKRDAKKASRRNEASTAIKNFVKGGGIIVPIIKGLTEAFDPKKKIEKK